MNFSKFIPLALTCVAVPLYGANPQVTLDFDAARRGPAISPMQYGIFYEEINNAGDGGLYAELIRNRSFEDAATPDFWSSVGQASLSITRAGLMNENRKAALNLKLNGADQGISNTGYWGIKCVAGDTFRLDVWLKSDKGYTGTMTGSIVDETGAVSATGSKNVALDDKWQKVTITLTSSDAARYVGNGKFNLTFSNSGSLTVGMVSLFPKTFMNRDNGCRVDLAEMLRDLRPKFMRFPGGCYIEGAGTLEGTNRFEWKKTIGPVEQRPGHANANWGYRSTDGLGFHEFLQLSEDIGAEPLFVVNVGIGHDWKSDFTDIEEYIQEALDALEYCNGGTDTFWGSKRAENGHPEPFNLRLLEIGNENYQLDDDRSDHYAERYKAFYDAIKAKYPEVSLIGNVEAWGTDDPSWRNSYPVEIVDEHYYRTPKWFESRYGKYDTYDRSGPKVYVGEYAVTDGYGTNGHLRAALGEAVYMQGMENNSDICVMASYAPIFYNEERGGGWLPDMIRFDNEQAFGTPSYHVQKLMPQYLGKQNLKWSEHNNLVKGGENKIGVSTWSTTAVFDNVKVTDKNGDIIFTDDFSDRSEWFFPSSYWTVSDGALRQMSSSEQGMIAYCKQVLPDSYILELDAKKLSGAEGFLIAVNYLDKNNYIWWNLGGWNNGQSGLQVCTDGVKSDFDLKPFNIESNRTYRVKVEVDGTKIKCWLDDQLVHSVALPAERYVYVSSSIDDKTATMYLKLVNTRDEDTPISVNMANASFDSAETIILTGSKATDENTMSNPDKVSPESGLNPDLSNGCAVYTAPANSLSIITFHLSDINYDPLTGIPATDGQIELLKKELASVASRLNWLHDDTSLPTMTSSGIALTWSQQGKNIEVSNNRYEARLEITMPNVYDHTISGGEVVANAKFPDGATALLVIPVNLAPKDSWHGYLYAYMNSQKEVTNYALGSKEGLGKKFEQLIDGEEIFNTAELASIEGGTRDSFLGRGENGQEYLMVTTDMCTAKSGVWNNYGIDLLRSEDLIHWESTAFDFRKGKRIFSDSEATTDCYKSDSEYAEINRVWAPQFIWDAAADSGKGAYLVYYSILSSNPGDSYDRIYYSYADRNFKTLTQPRLLFDAGVSLIDADIVFNEYDGLYHMTVKRTGTGFSSTGIYEYTSPALTGEDWTERGRIDNQNTVAVEAPAQIRRLDEDVNNLYFMRYDDDYSFKVADMAHDGGKAGLAQKVVGDGSFQHGSVIYVDKDEYDMLSLWSAVRSLLRQAENAKQSAGTTVFDEAIGFAEKTLNENRTVSALLDALPEAYDRLVAANGSFLAEGEPDADGFVDITHLMKNPAFAGDSRSGWNGTPFTNVSNGTAEHYSRCFDTYQTLKAMPAGTYRLQAQAFYRYGLPAIARPAHEDGSERLLASLYINDSLQQVMSLYDETYSNYPNSMWDANRAFNTDGKYTGNIVEHTLDVSSDLRIGIKKMDMADGDWTIFDNFRLLYNPDPDSVNEIDSSDPDMVNVYSAEGMLLRENVPAASATHGLDKGIYLVNGKKTVVK